MSVVFHWHNVSKVHSCCRMCQNFLPFKAEYYPIACIYYALFIHKLLIATWVVSTFGYCNNAVMNMSVAFVFNITYLIVSLYNLIF